MLISNYEKYRGKCKEFSEKLCKENPNLILVRGYYHCPVWGIQQHWWTKDQEGNIYDPTVKQFPTAGIGATYEEFNGIVNCEVCGKEIKEEQAMMMSSHPCCSDKCCRELVGI